MDALARVIGPARLDPLEPEWVVVQGRGIERWLSLELAERLGLFAHARFPFPRHFLDSALGSVLGDPEEETAAWEPESLSWSIAEVLPTRLNESAFAPIHNYLAEADGEEKRLALARRVAETFDHYAVYRPEMVLGWESGRVGPTPEEAWQAALWRDLVARFGSGHVAARVRDLLEALQAGRRPGSALPDRICLFGLSTLPPLYVSALAGLAQCIDVHAFVMSPSREYWALVRSEREKRLAQRGIDTESESELYLDTPGPPLLASLGRVAREFQEILEDRTQYHEINEDFYREPSSDDATGATLLRTLQSDMLALRTRGGPDAEAPLISLDPADHSLSIHACHGPMREAEVLRDQLLDLFQRQPDLKPRDVVVMAPDPTRYAPFVEAAFSAAPAIPVSVADRGMGQTFPAVDAFTRILALLDGRLEAGPVLDLLNVDPVRARFGLTSEDESLLRAWIEASGIRWGINSAHRVREGQPDSDTNTWRFGLDRLFVGLAIEDAPDRLFADVVPVAGVEGAQTAALGRLASFTETLFSLQDRVREPRPVAQWVELLVQALDDLVMVDADAAHERTFVVDELEDLARAARVAHSTELVSFGSVRDEVGVRLARGGTTGGFVTGAVTICEMLPMRSIPFRVVALMGMNDGDFPRNRPRASFDLIGKARQLGDRSARDDDRQMFLEAILSARDHLLISYVGQDIRDNQSRPPSVIVEELLDGVARMVVSPGNSSNESASKSLDWVRERLVLRHPLQPWSPRYFSPDGDDPLFSYASGWREAAGRLVAPVLAPAVFLTEPLHGESETPQIVSIDDLCRYFAHPARFLANERLGLRLSEAEDLEADREPLDVEGLEGFAIGEELLARALEGRDLQSLRDRLIGQGRLPLGRSGRVVFDELVAEVEQMVDQVTELRAGGPLPIHSVNCQIELPTEQGAHLIRVVGSLADLYPGGRVIQRFAKLERPSEFAVWIEHLCLCLSAPADLPRTSHLVGRGGSALLAPEVRFSPVVDAAAVLADLLKVYCVGQLAPLPLFPKASRKFADTVRRKPEDPTARERALLDARDVFTKSEPLRAEKEGVYVRQFFAQGDPLAESFSVVGMEDAADFRFSRLAERVFGPLFAHRDTRR